MVVVLSRSDAERYRKYKITEWYGIDPCELDDGRWVLPAKCVDDMTAFEGYRKNNVITKAVNVGVVLGRSQVVDVKEIKLAEPIRRIRR